MLTAVPLTYLAQAAAAAFFAGLLILMLRRPAERWGLVDHPGGRKRHAAPVPLTGGIAITAGMILALVVSFSAFAQYSAFFAGVLLLALVGLMDDLGEVSPGTKLLLQVVAALADDLLGRELPGQPRRSLRHQPDQHAPLGHPADGAGGAGSRQRHQHARRPRRARRQPRTGHPARADRLRLDDRRRERRQDPARAGRRAGRLPVLQSALAAARSPSHLHGRCRQHGARLRRRVVFGGADPARRRYRAAARDAVGARASC